MPIPIVLRPPVRKSRVSGHSVLVPTNSFILTIQVAQAVDVTVALGCVRTVHGFFAEDYYFCVRFPSQDCQDWEWSNLLCHEYSITLPLISSGSSVSISHRR
jgi:hypothetical protein